MLHAEEIQGFSFGKTIWGCDRAALYRLTTKGQSSFKELVRIEPCAMDRGLEHKDLLQNILLFVLF